MSESKALDDALYQRITELSARGDEMAADNDYEDAVAMYKAALGLLPAPQTDWEAATWLYVAIGDARFHQREFGMAWKALSNATFCPGGIGNPFLHLRLGQCALELGDREAAREELIHAYGIAGQFIFREDDPKYLAAIADLI